MIRKLFRRRRDVYVPKEPLGKRLAKAVLIKAPVHVGVRIGMTCFGLQFLGGAVAEVLSEVGAEVASEMTSDLFS